MRHFTGALELTSCKCRKEAVSLHFALHSSRYSRVQWDRPCTSASSRVVRPVLEVALWPSKSLTKETSLASTI